MKEGSVFLLDVRHGDEFEAGHLPGALNIELEDLETWVTTLPDHSTIIAYCRGAMCMLSADAPAWDGQKSTPYRVLSCGKRRRDRDRPTP
ncbi:rhodanese-like domain-containing protein [Pseudomonas fluorescens]|nr:rhodanese-like domain-containing protein [Pseudomonas fluorescens]